MLTDILTLGLYIKGQRQCDIIPCCRVEKLPFFSYSSTFFHTINTISCRLRLLTYMNSASLTFSNQDLEQMRIYKLSIIFVPMELVAALNLNV